MDNIALKRQTALMVLMALGAFAAIFYASDLDSPPVPVARLGEKIEVTVIAHANRDTIFNTLVKGQAPMTVLWALEMAAGKQRQTIGIQEYSFGKLVQSIGSYVAGPRGSWRYTVNGAFQKSGAERVELRSGDLVTWSFSAQSPDSL
jgi:hypothetical protein